MKMAKNYQSERSNLLDHSALLEGSGRSGKSEDLRTTPLFSLKVKHIMDKINEAEGDHKGDEADENEDDSDDSDDKKEDDTDSSKATPERKPGSDANPYFPQYSLLGFHVGDHPEIPELEPILQNTRTPVSTFICGSQGSGKSYTLSCLLENCLRPDPALGKPGASVAGLLFHYDVDSESQPAEAASLCSLGIRVRVLVSPTNHMALKGKYEKLPGAKDNLTVVPLYFHGHHLSVERMMKLMAFQEGDGRVPLYMFTIVKLLRERAMILSGKPFDYDAFKTQLAAEIHLSKEQTGPLKLRLDLLESFMPPRHGTTLDAFKNINAGTLTIIDMSCPFIDAATARLLFDISLGLFKAHRPSSGLVVALDEAHKFMDDSVGTSTFTERLLTTIREQRHVATRVIIATQEPTISPKLLDLCSVTIVHRFTSPAWFNAIKGHLGGAAVQGKASDEEKTPLFEKVMRLGVGESLVFAPSAYVCSTEVGAFKLEDGVVRMKTRKRMGQDQGLSKMTDDKLKLGGGKRFAEEDRSSVDTSWLGTSMKWR